MIVWINTRGLNGENSDPLEQMMLELMEPEIKFQTRFLSVAENPDVRKKANETL